MTPTPDTRTSGSEPFVDPAIRRTMQSNKGRDTTPELAVRSLLHASGLRFRVCEPLPFDQRRRADVTFTRVGLYVFIDGCFWHGCPEHYQAPKKNGEFWAAKVRANRERDSDTTAKLEAMGLEVMRFWEHTAACEVASQVIAAYWALRTRERSRS